MAHNTFGDAESTENAAYVASVKRQKAIRRCLKLFFRIMAAIAIIVLAALVIILALQLDQCMHNEENKVYSQSLRGDGDNTTICKELSTGKHCLTKSTIPATWSSAKNMCEMLGQSLPSTDICNETEWLRKYLKGTWSDHESSVFKPNCETMTMLSTPSSNTQEKDFFCVSTL
ncbi:putative EEV glycoprotein [Parapoxvirus red deer/HL953]|uniref:Protein OPG161 n=1 Tax=Parapoxvirus red deer/HL953 TaxID=1579460 RepID=A0A0A7MEV5_9POXV|nr:putative EEV glycoprotein [Parapoxvirus red deer/HL953]AIZ77361.1 putative EEV glycoprotein [Parapoxvirus red deer/HL953]